MTTAEHGGRGWTRRLAFPLLAALGVLALAEGAARLLHPGEASTGQASFVARGHEEYFGTRRVWVPYEAHPPYYWLPVAGTPITNSSGFRGRDWREAKSAGVVRIASLGDSCTLGGQESYSERLDRLLGEAVGTGRYEVLNAGVGSSSTHQMLQIFERHVLPLSPDVVVVFLGWNDRWVHDGRHDSAHRLPAAWRIRLRDVLVRSRLFQVCLGAFERWQGGRVEQRVPVEETAGNLRRFAGLCRERSIRLYLATTPDGMPEEAIARRFSGQLPHAGWYAELYALIRPEYGGPVEAWRGLHRAYNETLKRVAGEQGVPVIDLDAALPARRRLYPGPQLQFFKDGIHFTELGLQEVARLLALHLVTGREQQQVAAYSESGPYYLANAAVFARQYQYAAADAFLRQAALRGTLPPQAGSLQEQIERERPFYDRYDAARIRLSLLGDRERALQDFLACLDIRPQDQDLRLDAAELARDIGRFPTALELTLAYQGFSPANLQRALWIAAEAAEWSGQRGLALRVLGELDRAFPQDPRARDTLARLGVAAEPPD